MTVRILAASAILLAGVTVGSAVQAQQAGSSGSTSGPAAGGNVQPSTAVQKDNMQSQGAGAHTGAPATAAGAPGATARPGTEAGPAAKPASK
jgi:hypothetical protein